MKRRRKTFSITVGLTLLAGLFMPNAMLTRMEDVSYVLNIPLVPMRHGANLLADWFRPAPRSRVERMTEAELEVLLDDKEFWRTQYRAAQASILKLKEELEQVSKMRWDLDDMDSVRIATARITGRNPTRRGASVEVNLGTERGVRNGAIAVYRGTHLVGYVTQAAALRSVVTPITSPSKQFIRGRVMAPEADDVDPDRSIHISLRADSNGTLVAAVDNDAAIEVGDWVYLDDEAWPSAAQLMVVGAVDEIRPKDDQPLRNDVIVRPLHSVGAMSKLTLIIEPPAVLADGTEDAP